jgi:hypothetical protein
MPVIGPAAGNHADTATRVSLSLHR